MSAPRSAVVTGSSRGIGRDLAVQLLERGYTVIASPEKHFYITPGLTNISEDMKDYGVMDPEWLYHHWTPEVHPNLLGYKICVWADRVEAWPDSAFEDLLEKPRAILAERLWGGRRGGKLEDFYERLGKVGKDS